MDFDAIDRLRKQLAAQQASIAKALAPMELVTKQFAQQIAQIQSPMQQFAKNYAESISKIVDFAKNIDWEGFDEFEREFGWLEAITMTYAFKLKDVLKAEGKEAVWDKLIEDLNDAEFLDEFSVEIEDVDLIKGRSHITEKALEHHKNKDYISSIPLILSQVEGMIWDLGIYKKVVEDQPNSKYKIDVNGRCVLDSRGKKIQWRFGELLQYMFGKESKLANHTEENVYSKELRHPILHGRQTDYGDAQNSTMLVLLLYTIVEKVKDETRSQTQAN